MFFLNWRTIGNNIQERRRATWGDDEFLQESAKRPSRNIEVCCFAPYVFGEGENVRTKERFHWKVEESSGRLSYRAQLIFLHRRDVGTTGGSLLSFCFVFHVFFNEFIHFSVLFIVFEIQDIRLPGSAHQEEGIVVSFNYCRGYIAIQCGSPGRVCFLLWFFCFRVVFWLEIVLV